MFCQVVCMLWAAIVNKIMSGCELVMSQLMLEGVGSFCLNCLGFAMLGLEQLGEAAKQDFLTSPWAVRPAGTNIALNNHSIMQSLPHNKSCI